ncbi:MAG TPA: hypothetical protein VMS63_08200 [Gaiellaceae bacterium]|nr:hypothetical protein [Gaiellaceae bacterium]
MSSRSKSVPVLALMLTAAMLAATGAAASSTRTPQLVGAAVPGGTLRVVVPARWHNPTATSVTYAWLACDSVDCGLISFGSQSSLVVPHHLDPNRTWRIIVVVTARSGRGATSISLTSPVVPPDSP